MKNLLLTKLAVPVVTRLGTALGAFLLAQDIDAETAQQIVTGVTAAACLGIDFVTSWMTRRYK